VYAATSRRSALVLVALTALLAIVALSTTGADDAQAAPGDDPPTPLFNMEFQNLPSDMMRYPTKGWTGTTNVHGFVASENYRPEDVLIYLNASIDNNWFVSVYPMMFTAPTSHMAMEPFKVQVQVPPHTFGPDVSVLYITAIAKIQTRTLMEISTSVNLHFLSNVDEMLEGMASIVMVLDSDRTFSDRLTLSNLFDERQEFHLCALGEWADRIPDLDFHGGGVTLASMEQRNTVYMGHLQGDVEIGVFQVELALWTPDGEGGRTFILNRTVQMEVLNIDSLNVSFLEEFFLVIIIIAITAVAVAFLMLRWLKRRREAQLLEQYRAFDQNSYHAGMPNE